ncbi:hypothetical protein, partial [Terribacillus sp. AE2B 122]
CKEASQVSRTSKGTYLLTLKIKQRLIPTRLRRCALVAVQTFLFQRHQNLRKHCRNIEILTACNSRLPISMSLHLPKICQEMNKKIS